MEQIRAREERAARKLQRAWRGHVKRVGSQKAEQKTKVTEKPADEVEIDVE